MAVTDEEHVDGPSPDFSLGNLSPGRLALICLVVLAAYDVSRVIGFAFARPVVDELLDEGARLNSGGAFTAASILTELITAGLAIAVAAAIVVPAVGWIARR